MEFIEPEIETGIPCFVCKEHSGLDCAGRKPNESTMCGKCFKSHWSKVCKEQDDYEREYFRKLRRKFCNKCNKKFSDLHLNGRCLRCNACSVKEIAKTKDGYNIFPGMTIWYYEILSYKCFSQHLVSGVVNYAHQRWKRDDGLYRVIMKGTGHELGNLECFAEKEQALRVTPKRKPLLAEKDKELLDWIEFWNSNDPIFSMIFSKLMNEKENPNTIENFHINESIKKLRKQSDEIKKRQKEEHEKRMSTWYGRLLERILSKIEF